MKIALDYDDTFTADKDLWHRFVVNAKHRGHEVRFVTARWKTTPAYTNEDIIFDAHALDIPIIFCEGVQKEDACYDHGFHPVDIWIDDFPVLIPTIPKLEGTLRGSNLYDEKQRESYKKLLGSYPDEPLIIGGALDG